MWRRLIYESVNIFFLLLSRLQGYPSIEHLFLADSSLARVFFIEALIYLRLCLQRFCFLLIRSSNCLIHYTMFQAHHDRLSSFCLFHVACMYTTEEEPANELYLCWFLNTVARLSLVATSLFLLFGRFIAQELVHKSTLIYDSVHSEFHLKCLCNIITILSHFSRFSETVQFVIGLRSERAYFSHFWQRKTTCFSITDNNFALPLKNKRKPPGIAWNFGQKKIESL